MKKNYKKPSVRKVKLIPTEAVLQACKSPNAGGPTLTGCMQAVAALPCSAIGS